MACLQYLKEGKAAGPDKIFTDLLLHANEKLVIAIHKVLNFSFKTGKLPEEWRTDVVSKEIREEYLSFSLRLQINKPQQLPWKMLGKNLDS